MLAFTHWLIPLCVEVSSEFVVYLMYFGCQWSRSWLRKVILSLSLSPMSSMMFL